MSFQEPHAQGDILRPILAMLNLQTYFLIKSDTLYSRKLAHWYSAFSSPSADRVFTVKYF
jgi:hypothetical protein